MELNIERYSDVGTRYTSKISSLRPSSYFYIQDKNQVLCSLKKHKFKQESLLSRKLKQEFYVSIKLKQANRESSESSIEQNPKTFQVLIPLAGWI